MNVKAISYCFLLFFVFASIEYALSTNGIILADHTACDASISGPDVIQGSFDIHQNQCEPSDCVYVTSSATYTCAPPLSMSCAKSWNIIPAHPEECGYGLPTNKCCQAMMSFAYKEVKCRCEADPTGEGYECDATSIHCAEESKLLHGTRSFNWVRLEDCEEEEGVWTSECDAVRETQADSGLPIQCPTCP